MAMASLRKSLAYFLIILAVLIVFAGLALATTTYFTVQSGKETTHQIKLYEEDRVLIKFTVVGQASNILRFYLVFPNATERDFGEVGTFSYNFICKAEENYTLRFVNNDLTENKQVTLDYEVDHYILGMPQMLFLTIVIAVVCVIMVAMYVLLGKTS
jgi:hypothetical protein